MGDQFLVIDVLSLKGNGIMRSSAPKSTIETLYLFVSQLHLRFKVFENKTILSPVKKIFNIVKVSNALSPVVSYLRA